MLALISLLLSIFLSYAAAEEVGRFLHSFPHRNSRGLLITNEFELLYPENIQPVDRATSNATYSFVRIDPLVISNDDVVSVSYYSSSPSSKDWIGAYSPADVQNITTTTPVKYGYCDEDANYLTRGVGTLTFNLTNLRANVSFYYFTNGLSSPVLQTKASDQVQFKDINEPLRPRFVPVDTNDFLFLWSSANSQKPIIRWGTSSGKYSRSIKAATSTIPKSSLCGAPANTIGWRDQGLIHTARLPGLRSSFSGRKIYYIFGDQASGDFSSEHVFFVPPLPGNNNVRGRPTTAILYDDLGRGSSDLTYTWNEYGRPAYNTLLAVGYEAQQGNIDVIYHGGDISYAVGYLSVWDFFLDMISPAASAVPYLTTVGNHESDWYDTASSFSNSDSGGECGVLTTRLLPLPSPANENKDQPWWSYEVGLIHFVGISTEHDFTVDSPQYLWLQQDLKSVNRTITPWIIFGGHRAMYLNSNYGGSVSSDITVMDSLIENLEPLLYKYQVNIGFYGHNHVVQRQAAVYNRTVVQHAEARVDAEGNTIYFHDKPKATVHLVVGTGGAAFTKNAVNPPPEWNELVFYEWGYAKVTAVNSSYLDWQWIQSESGKVLDHMVITQDISESWQ